MQATRDAIDFFVAAARERLTSRCRRPYHWVALHADFVRSVAECVWCCALLVVGAPVAVWGGVLHKVDKPIAFVGTAEAVTRCCNVLERRAKSEGTDHALAPHETVEQVADTNA